MFSNPADMPLPPERKSVWDEIDAARGEMMRSLGSILDRLRADYVDVDIHKTNAKAWSDYVEFQREVDDAVRGRKGPRKRKNRKKG